MSRVVERLFLTVPRGCLQFVIVVFPDHTHLLFLITFWTNIGPYDIVIYFTLINLTETECIIQLLLKSYLFFVYVF